MNEGGAFLQKGVKNTSENTHEKRGGSFGEPVGEGDLNNSLYPQFSDFLGGSHGDIGLGARADLRSCWEWYHDHRIIPAKQRIILNHVKYYFGVDKIIHP